MNTKRLFAIRGAVCTENTVEDIIHNVELMCNKIFELNNILAEDVVSIQFSMTKDLNSINAATAFRKSNCIIDNSLIPLFCTQEVDIPSMMPKTIRVMVTTYLNCENLKQSDIKNVYLNGAENLRPDFCKGMN